MADVTTIVLSASLAVNGTAIAFYLTGGLQKLFCLWHADKPLYESRLGGVEKKADGLHTKIGSVPQQLTWEQTKLKEEIESLKERVSNLENNHGR